MTTKAPVVIYFMYQRKEEAVEFDEDDNIEVVRSLFQTAAGAEPGDTLKLHNEKGNLVFIYAKLKPNDPSSRYLLKVIPKEIHTRRLLSLIPAAEGDVDRILQRLSLLETKSEAELQEKLSNLQKKYDYVIKTINGLSYLDWLRVPKDDFPKGKSRIMSYPFWWQPSLERTEIHHRQIKLLFFALTKVGISEEVKEDLRKPSFDNWQWSDAQMLAQMRQMYIDLDIVSKLNMEEDVLHNWLYKVYTSYNLVPFHNFRHCFSVTQMMYSLIWTLDLKCKLDHVDIFTLLTAAACHDLDHPGLTNAYQANADTELYNQHKDSTLEHHHIDVAFSILSDEACNIARFLPEEQHQPFRDLMTRIILATDLAKSGILLSSLKEVTEFDIRNQEHKHLLMVSLVKVSDISNETRKLSISGRWLDCLLQEFFNQYELESLEGLPKLECMNKATVTRSSAQIGFIEGILLPLLRAVHRFCPKIQPLIDNAQENMNYYIELKKKYMAEGSKDKTEPLSVEPGSCDVEMASPNSNLAKATPQE
ncbi:hypothetical protein BsWGS_26034 [Bradybaena similaris]